MGLLHKIARLYTFNSPIRKGSYRIAQASLQFGGPLPDTLEIRTADGRSVVINPGDSGYQFAYFLGEYEPAITRVMTACVEPGDTVLDIGANIGWFTTLLMGLSGPEGKVYAFEPMPEAFESLETNIKLNKSLGAVKAELLALGDDSGQVQMTIGEGLPAGHAAVVAEGEESESSTPVEMTTLDKYLKESGCAHVDFLKADIEGSELFMLRGATCLFDQEVPPTMIIEMALDTTRKFGYSPDEIIDFISSKSEYFFFAISEKGEILTEIEGFEPGSKGANVLCLPKAVRETTKDKLRTV